MNNIKTLQIESAAVYSICMARNDTTSAIIGAVLKFAVTGTALSVGIVVPNALVALEKPLKKFMGSMDKREREREARRIIHYMKSQGLLKGEYEHGLKITPKGRKRLTAMEFENISIPSPKKWDHTWRLVFYDIPEKHRYGRDTLVSKLRELGFFQLQQSVWIYPFACREVIEKVTSNFGLERHVSYIETPCLDNESVLIQRFKKRLPTVDFK